jgi:tellurite resistance protein
MSMIGKAGFSEEEWETLRRGLTGTGMLVSVADPGFMDSIGESNALAKYLQSQRVAGDTKLIRELSAATGTGFGLTAKPDEVRDGTIAALRSAVEILTAKAPEELEPYRQVVLGIATAVAEAKKGVSPSEEAVIEAVKEALGAA